MSAALPQARYIENIKCYYDMCFYMNDYFLYLDRELSDIMELEEDTSSPVNDDNKIPLILL